MTPYHAQAAIASVHARAADAGATDWKSILELYDDLLQLAPSPVTALNRTVALSRLEGPLAALAGIAEIERGADAGRLLSAAVGQGEAARGAG
jgi:RNA polymerase sigma-70 factor (ECF subfamily)